jgi:hypothetical protein
MNKCTPLGKAPYETTSVCEIWELDPPYEGHTRVLTSMACNYGGLLGMGDWITETNLYECDEDGEVPDWDKALCSMEECHSGTELLNRLGYEG